MERWLSMQLAEQLGVWANGEFPFPEKMLWRIFKDTLGYLPEKSKFEREVMTWMLMDILPSFLTNHQFPELHSYLQDQEPMKHYQLAVRLAETFDQYIVYRPQWIGEWERGQQPLELADNPQARWQATLWQVLTQRYGTQHRAKLRADFFQKVRQLTTSNSRFPKRWSIFGIPALPPFYLEVLSEIGQLTEVHIFLFNPCQEFWGDIVSDTDIAHKIARIKGKLRTPEEQYLEKGNTLLAVLGKLGRDFMDMLNELPHSTHDYFEEIEETNLLTSIQADILHLQERGVGKNLPKQLVTTDKSIQIHACHSPMREVEVLHDQLLALFEENPELLPKDVLVMMPDIEKYASFIQAVFATTPDEAKQIPFSLADRSLRSNSTLIEAFFAILELNHSRFAASEVLAVLEVAAVQRRFHLVEPDLDLIRHWIEKTGIRWGMDGKSRERLALPAYEENTWRAGLKRLLLGYALPTNGADRLFQNIFPFDDIEGSDALILGKLVAFVEHLFEYVSALSKPRTLPEWATFLTNLLERFFSPDEENEGDAQQVRKVLTDLVTHSTPAGFQATVSSEVIIAHLRQHLESEPLPTNFMTGQVSFGTMLPMRSIPFKVVCLLGMDDQAYPRANKPLSFDLIAQYPQRGDRSRRQNDRYLFLEALLSAREYFYISYVGHSIRDNTEMPPSVLVSDLLDYIKTGFTHPAYPQVLDYVVTHHPLQAFSPRYFNNTEPRLFSYSAEYCAASTVLLTERKANFFLGKNLPDPTAEWKTVSIDKLARFFAHPTQFLLKERLGIELRAGMNLLEETEPFEIQGLDRYTLNQTLVEKSLAGQNLQNYRAIAKASGQLPHGRIGEYVYSKLTGEIQPFVEKVRQATRQDQIVARPFTLTIEDMRITGQLSKLWRSHLIHYRCTKLKAKDHIKLWLHHLILNSLADDHLPRHSLLIGEDGVYEYQPVSNTEEILKELLTRYYWPGMVQPLHFFPESSFSYAHALNNGKTVAEAIHQAQKKWRGEGNEFSRGEGEDDYYQLCFGRIEESSPLDQHFEELAMQFFKPLWTCHEMKAE
jgi:exodeoxyribonuclease V gamma subunit